MIKVVPRKELIVIRTSPVYRSSSGSSKFGSFASISFSKILQAMLVQVRHNQIEHLLMNESNICYHSKTLGW